VSTDCAPPAEFTKNLVNGIEITDMHIENACKNTESIIKHNVFESSVEQGENIALPENMDISCDFSQQGKVAKCYLDKGANSYEIIERHYDPPNWVKNTAFYAANLCINVTFMKI
jgi:hypothetical protein